MSVSSIGSHQSNLFILQMLRQEMNLTQERISTGKKGSMLSDLGGANATHVMSYRNTQTLMNGYISNLNTVKSRVSVMDKAMGNMAESARDVLSTLRKQVQTNDTNIELLRADAQSALDSVLNKLNVRLGDRYLFAGSDITNAPFGSTSDLAGNISAEIAALMGGGSFDKDDVVNAMRGVNGTALGFSNTSLAADKVTFRADDGRDLDYTVMAHRAGFSDVLRGLSIIANLPTPTNDAETQQYWTLVNGAMDLLDQGSRQVDHYQGTLGSTARSVTELLSAHEDNRLTMENFIGSVEDIDTAEAATKLELLKAQLQISYSVTASLNQLSLANYI
jgi:flagellar hook-associated protein 3 FlgL